MRSPSPNPTKSSVIVLRSEKRLFAARFAGKAEALKTRRPQSMNEERGSKVNEG
jgi:hypothetical protein